jgi:hypothetical protein
MILMEEKPLAGPATPPVEMADRGRDTFRTGGPAALAIHGQRFDLTAASKSDNEIDKEPAMSKPTIDQARMGTEGIAFCIARTLIERDPSLKAPMRANLRKMWELLEEREDHGAADMVDTMIKALNDPAFFKP